MKRYAANSLFALGDFISALMSSRTAWLYPAYNAIMNKASALKNDNSCNGWIA